MSSRTPYSLKIPYAFNCTIFKVYSTVYSDNENENQQSDEGNKETENEHAEEPWQREAEANMWWQIVKEVELIKYGFHKIAHLKQN